LYGEIKIIANKSPVAQYSRCFKTLKFPWEHCDPQECSKGHDTKFGVGYTDKIAQK